MPKVLQAAILVPSYCTSCEGSVHCVGFPETPVNADSYGGYMAGRTLSLILPLLDLTRISIVENGSHITVAWHTAGVGI
ncbi:hypothetical protein B0H14DRAFT_2729874, partial [Mycena olivaceomarginata]